MGKRTILLTALLVTAAAAWAPGQAWASNDQLRGTQQLVDEETGQYRMHGDLYGDWYTTAFTVTGAQPSGTFQAEGTETFIGCRDLDHSDSCGADEPTGWLDFTFKYSASASGNGRCHHPIVGSGGDFAGARGQLNFKDRTGSCGVVSTTYSGHLDY
jgi:hypothetical protein